MRRLSRLLWEGLVVFYKRTFSYSMRRPSRLMLDDLDVGRSSASVGDFLVFNENTFSSSLRIPSRLLWGDLLASYEKISFLSLMKKFPRLLLEVSLILYEKNASSSMRRIFIFYQKIFPSSVRKPTRLLWKYLLVFCEKLSHLLREDFRLFWEDLVVLCQNTFSSSMRRLSRLLWEDHLVFREKTFSHSFFYNFNPSLLVVGLTCLRGQYIESKVWVSARTLLHTTYV